MKLSQSSAYALFAIARLAAADPGGAISCAQLADSGRLPQRYLLQILRALARRGIVISTRGGNGGFSLARGADEISLLEIVEAVEGPIALRLALDEHLLAESPLGTLQNVLAEAETTMREVLARISVAQFAAHAGPRARTTSPMSVIVPAIEAPAFYPSSSPTAASY
jgi:Rrf2 family protein